MKDNILLWENGLMKNVVNAEELENKEIHFYLDETFYDERHPVLCYTYDSTKRFIEDGAQEIHTTSIANISFDLLDLGYRIFLHRNNKVLECKPGMDGTERDIRYEHNILRLIMGHTFDNYFKN